MKTKAKEDDNRAWRQAAAQLQSVRDMVAAHKKAVKSSIDKDIEYAEQRILEDPLSVEVRSGWVSTPNEFEAEEYRILLCTGGPAVQIVGELNQYNEPETATLQYQDWCTPWCDYLLDTRDEEALVYYSRQFYYGG